jgi:hypothetical protein
MEECVHWKIIRGKISLSVSCIYINYEAIYSQETVRANSPASSKVIICYICNMQIKQTNYKLKDMVHMISPMPKSV